MNTINNSKKARAANNGYMPCGFHRISKRSGTGAATSPEDRDAHRISALYIAEKRFISKVKAPQSTIAKQKVYLINNYLN